MKKVFSVVLTLVALLGIIQITAAPSYADSCEDICQWDYEQCMQISGNPTLCNNIYQNCLDCCYGHP